MRVDIDWLFLMKNLIYGMAALMLPVCLGSCAEGYDKRMMQVVEDWQGKEVQLPENSVFTIQGEDTVNMDISVGKYNHRVLVYVDSAGCTSCHLQLRAWKQFIAEVDSLVEDSVQFLFYLTPKNMEEARYITLSEDFTHPMCIDKSNRIDHLNHFPEEDMFHVFLLDRENKVTVIGNPVRNNAVRSMFIKTMGGGDSENKQ